ncbi:MAG: orotate phosphoribosyltransferase [Thermodesulfobacteriota bacterium]
MSLKKERDRLRSILIARSVEFGDFTLSSGEKSGVYIDARKTTLDPEGARLAAAIFLDLFSKDGRANAIGGPTLGADPIVGAMLALCGDTSLRGFIVRKQEKGHGTQRRVEGNLQKGDRAVLVEDVVTTGGSVMRAAEAVRALGAEVLSVMAIVKRGDAQALFEKEGIGFHAIFDADELTAQN